MSVNVTSVNSHAMGSAVSTKESSFPPLSGFQSQFHSEGPKKTQKPEEIKPNRIRISASCC